MFPLFFGIDQTAYEKRQPPIEKEKISLMRYQLYNKSLFKQR